MQSAVQSVVKHILKHVDKGVNVVVEGESGSGKTTFVNEVQKILKEKNANIVFRQFIVDQKIAFCKTMHDEVSFYEKLPTRNGADKTKYDQDCPLILVVFRFEMNSRIRDGIYRREESHSIRIYVNDGFKYSSDVSQEY